MLIRDIEPIGKPNMNLLETDENDIIDEIIELPLRNACRIFREKGIETVMSSANRNNLLKEGEKPIEKEDVYAGYFKILETHTFYEAGKGYAWIMVNFDTLSNENKDLMFELEDKIGGKLVWFAHPNEMTGNIEFSLKTGRYDYEFLRKCMGEDTIPKGLEVDERLIEFEKRHIVLLYPWMDSSTEAVFLRMPITEHTTVDEVSDYFSNLARCFKNQNNIKEDNKKLV